MLVLEIQEIYTPKAEVVILITTEEIEYFLSQKLGIKKADFDIKFWDEIISRCKKSIVKQINENYLMNLMGKELAEFVMEGPIPSFLQVKDERGG